MKFLQQLFVVTFLLSVLAGCGSNGGGDYNGDLTVVPSQSSTSASFTIQYAKSGVSNYAGLGCKINTTINGELVDGTPDTFSSSGIIIKAYDKLVAGDYVRLEAKVGDIVSSAAVTIKAGDLSVSPESYDFTLGGTGTSTQPATISGGTSPYLKPSSSTSDIKVNTISNAVFTVTVVNKNNTTSLKTAIITVSDSSSPIKTAKYTVTY